MARIRPGYDWGQRFPRWAGVTSEVVVIGGARVHYLRAGVEGNGPTHLLIHPMGAGAWSWMDVIGPLSARGVVIAPDLPGSGRSRARPSFGTILVGGVVPAVYATAEGYRFTRSRFLAVAAAPAVVISVLGPMACLGPWAGRLASEISAWACRQTLPTR